MQVTVLGAGSWGTGLACLFAKHQEKVVLYGRSPEGLSLNSTHHNPLAFPEKELPANISYTNHLETALQGSQIIVFSVPSGAYREMARKVLPFLTAKVYLVSTAKGFDPATQERLSEVLREEIPETKRYPIVSLLGPSYASEVMDGLLTAVASVSQDLKAATFIQKAVSSESFRVYTQTDEIGAEVSAALKNVLAIASGILDGLAQGSNARAALITRGIAEIRRLALALGSQSRTFLGLTGIGDLVLTCTSPQSRNFYLGRAIGQANDAKNVLKNNTQTTEGVVTAKVALELANKLGIDMPITAAVETILFEGKRPSEVIRGLMERSLKEE
jgi:glycerol-3-phosphate dehydrogenase (NAD(P)+)